MIQCKNCGVELEDDMQYCPLCGTPVAIGNGEREITAADNRAFSHRTGKTGWPWAKQFMQRLSSRFKRIFHT